MLFDIEALDLIWPWTPLMPTVYLEPGTTFRVNLTVPKPCPNVFVVLFSGKQLTDILPMLSHNGHGMSSYVAASWRASLAQSVNATFQIFSEDAQSLGILTAAPQLPPVRLHGFVSFEGPGGHLPPEEQVNAQIANVLCGASLFSAWLLLLSMRSGRSRLHGVFLGCFLLKALVLLSLALDLRATNATGRQSPARAAAWQMLRHLQETSVLALFFLIGLGWKITRSQLRGSEWAFGSAALAVSLLLRGMEVLCSALKVCSPQRYMLTLFTVNSLCSLVVIVSTNFNIFLLSRQLIEANASQEAGVLYAKLQAYITFRVCFLYFVMIPVICGTALRIISWRSMWMVKETLEWCVLSVVLWLWRPGYMKAVRVFQLSAAPPSESEAESVEDVEE
ncbi:unnamed protein product [Effrenium voratum]|uniref:Uncharacterized protein n=2 Tax=Effrenium voratum TaxID=2562239 RepID=A0AA36IDW7_9DINO|nr:unnamed protein product [Effrenium voratum]